MGLAALRHGLGGFYMWAWQLSDVGLVALGYRVCFFSDMALGMGAVPDLERPLRFALDKCLLPFSSLCLMGFSRWSFWELRAQLCD